MTMIDDTPLLQLHQVEKKFGHHQALHPISFSLSSGSITALLGDNGAGKSTLVKILMGYHQPDKGTLYWQGKLLQFSKNQGPKEARHLGIQVVYQHLGLIDHLSTWRNFFLGNELVKGRFPFKRLDIERMRAMTAQALKQFDTLRKWNLDAPIAHLSGGERQAIAICRATYFHSKLLILDEPTSALSQTNTNNMLEYMKHIAKTGVAILFITHHPERIVDVADHIILLHQGRIIDH